MPGRNTHYTAEVEQYKSQVARQERHYTAEIEDYKTQLGKQERHYTGEIEVYKSEIAGHPPLPWMQKLTAHVR